MADIVCRASNRMLVGLPLCARFLVITLILIQCFTIGRDPDYLELNKQFAFDVIKSNRILRMFPHLLKPYGWHDVFTQCMNIDALLGLLHVS
jgi:hypothetical protein